MFQKRHEFTREENRNTFQISMSARP